MPVETIDGTNLNYYLVAFDAGGTARPEPDGSMEDKIVGELEAEPITDVFILSHGWRGDVPAARDQYSAWIHAMAAQENDRQRIRAHRPGFKATLVGLHWPSEPWGDEDLGGPASFDVGAEPPDIDALVERWAVRLAETAEAKAALRIILAAAAEDPTPPSLPDEVREAYLVVDRETGLGADGPGGPPDADRKPFDPELAYQASFDDADDFDLGSMAGGIVGGLLTPLKQLSFWKMKARARIVGETGAHRLLRRILTVPNKAHLRVHLMGHSFGCIVVTAMVAGPPGGDGPPRPVSSIALVQGALSLWSYCKDIPVAPGKPGYFHPLLARGSVVGPLIATMSSHDRALGTWYPKGAGLAGHVEFEPGELPTYGAVGTHGVAGLGSDSTDLRIQPMDHEYDFVPGRVYNLDADDVIKEGGGFSGAHSDIARPEVAHAVWQAAIGAP